MLSRPVDYGQTRLYVRMEGLCPFALVVEEELCTEALEGAARHYVRNRYGPEADWEYTLVRRIVFAGGDQLMDFARKKKEHLIVKSISDAEASVTSSRHVGVNFAFVNVLPVYHDSSSFESIRESSLKAASAQNGNNVTEEGARVTTALFSSLRHLSFVAFHRLVLMMTDPHNPQRDLFARVVLLTYRRFALPGELLERLVERYEVPPLTRSGHSDRSSLEHQSYLELRRSIQCLVFGVLELWVKKYYEDFSDDLLYHRLHTWAKMKIDQCRGPTLLLQLMSEGNRTALHRRPPVFLPGISSQALTPTTVLNQCSPQEIATQITILTSHVHRQLTGPELIGLKWETNEAQLIPNVARYREFFSKVKNWASYVIVSEKDLERRSQNLAVLLFVCDELMKMQNWDMLVAMYSGLKDPSITRLRRTWASLPRSAVSLSTELQLMLDIDTGYKTLRNVVHEKSRLHFPCIAIFFQELRELEDSICSKQGLVNFGCSLQQYQLLQYLLLGRDVKVSHLVPNDELMGSFFHWRPVDASALMQLSNSIEAN